MKRKLILIFLIIIFLIFPKKNVFALETGFRPSTTCQTNGSSCSAMEAQDSSYNSWTGSVSPEIVVTFTDFNVPDDAIIDDIQIKMRIKTSTFGWTWLVKQSFDGGTTYSPPAPGCIATYDWCRYNTLSTFNSVNNPTLTWIYDSESPILGEDITSSNFSLKLSQSSGIKNTDIDMLLFNIRYHFGDIPQLSYPGVYFITKGFQSRGDMPNNGSKFFIRTTGFKYKGGRVILSSTPDGKGTLNFADQIRLDFLYPYANLFTYNSFSPDCSTIKSNIPPIDITDFFKPGLNKPDSVGGFFTLSAWCPGVKKIGPIYLVNLPDDPSPFLDLPWDYQSKSKTFSNAALSINSFFDHEYPLLGFLSEPSTLSASVVPFYGWGRLSSLNYSAHNGYDYGKRAGVNYKDAVLAAASGTAQLVTSCADCGNMIKINHGNGYETLYMHLADEGLITNTPGLTVPVGTGQKIGEVGFTGNVSPSGENGAHIHFGVIQDKNNDGTFNDNSLDGLMDPFGWQSKSPDPWASYSFDYGGAKLTGNKSFYLWLKNLDGLETTITATTGGTFTSGSYTVSVPQNEFSFSALLEMNADAMLDVTDTIVALIPGISITIKNAAGDLITQFDQPMGITVDFSDVDITKYKAGTISVYSSTDGKLWVKESTVVDYVNKTATTEVSHLTHFALMGEKADTISPATQAVLYGTAGESGFYRSNVALGLNAQDNDNGSGIEYIAIRKEGEDWKDYKEPLIITEEGNYKYYYYSEDIDGNVEQIKSIQFTIDKTPPTALLNISPFILWPPNGKPTPVTIEGTYSDDNPLDKPIFISDEYEEINLTNISLPDTVFLTAQRTNDDFDGRHYAIEARDKAGNVSSTKMDAIVPHDQGNVN